MDEKLTSAIIAAIISIVGIVINFYFNRKKNTISEKEIENRIKEIEIKNIELTELGRKIDVDLDNIKQSQLNIVLEKRIIAYQKLWNVTLKYGRNWFIFNKKTDLNWASDFLEQINEVNEEYGVFFSETVYGKFYLYREQLILIYHKLKNGGININTEIDKLSRINIGEGKKIGLSTAMKNDLGSYNFTLIEKRNLP